MVKRLAVFAPLLALVVFALGCRQMRPVAGQPVVLVHGLWRSAPSMSILGHRLEDAGYRVILFDYPSMTESLEELTDRLESAVEACCESEVDSVHFVTHSMGGILVRSYLARRSNPYSGRVVMLSPPNQGSEIVDAFAKSKLLSLLVGRAGLRLGTDSASIAITLPPADFDVGIIAGNRSLSPLGSWLIPGPDDGKVSVESTRLEGAADFMVLPTSHTFIMNRRDVARQAIYFLENGRFEGPAAQRP